MLLSLLWKANSQTADITVGTGTATTTNAPIYGLYNYSYSQILYLGSEISGVGGSSGLITKLRFKISSLPTTPTNSNSWTIYLGNTTLTSLTVGPTNYVGANALQLSYSGIVTFPSATGNWMEIILSNPFSYTGGNLLVAVLENSAGYSSASWYATATSSNMTNYLYDDTELPNPNALPGAYTAGSSSTLNRPNIQLQIQTGPCTGTPTPGNTLANATNICMGGLVNLSTQNVTQGTGVTYQWQSSADNNTWNNIPTGGNNMTYSTTLSTSTYFRCAVTCSGNTGYSNSVQINVPTLISGSAFTINKSLPTGGNNFANFADAVDYIKCGISGTVTFNVVSGSGPYTITDPIVIQNIYGAKASSPIIFNGNGETINYTASATDKRSAILLNGAKHLIFDSLNINVGAGTYGIGVQFMNHADSNTIRKCTIITNSSSTTSNYTGIAFSSSLTAAGISGENGSGNLIEKNKIVGGYYGITVVGLSGTSGTNNIIRYNSIENFYYYGIYSLYQTNLIVQGNDVSRSLRTASPSTVYSLYFSTSNAGNLIDGNRIHNSFTSHLANTTTYYSIALTSAGTSSLPNIVTNNLIYSNEGNGTHYGIYNSGAAYMKAYHNTIAMDYAAATAGITYGFYQSTVVDSIVFKNNIIYITRGGSGAKYGIYKSTATTPIISNYNVFYLGSAGSGTQSIGYQTAALTDLNAWTTTTSQDANSTVANPLFANPSIGDYIFTEPTLDDKGTPVGVLKDITGINRSLTAPDPGAYELPPSTGLDMKTEALVSPAISNGSCYKTETIVVKIKNNSINTIDFSLHPTTITVNVTGAANAIYTAIVNSGTLLGDSSLNVTMTTPSATLNMSANGIYAFEITTTVVGDVNGTNNMISVQREKLALNAGNSTINNANLCISGLVPTLSATSVEGFEAVKWQESMTSSTGFTDISGANTITYTLTAMPLSTRYYRLVATCDINTSISSEIMATVDNPQMTNTTPATRCGPGTVNLNALATGFNVNWYADSIGGQILYTGNTFTTPFLNKTDTFYAAPVSLTSVSIPPVTIGAGALASTSYESPYYHVYGNKVSQYLFRASELLAAGMSPGNITSLAFNVITPGTIYNNFNLSLKLTNAVSMSTSFESNLTTVYTVASTTPVAGINTYDFSSTPFTWDGVSNLILQVCWSNNNTGGVSTTVKYDNTTYPSNAYQRVDGSVSSGTFCSQNTAYATTNSRPQTIFAVDAACQGIRVPVIATISTPPAIHITATKDSICSGQSVNLNVTSSNTGYSYSWTPNAVSGASQTVSPTINTKYIVDASDNSGGAYNGCTNRDSININVFYPLPVTVSSSATKICATKNPAIKMYISLENIPILSENFEAGAPNWTIINSSSGGTNPSAVSWTIKSSPATISSETVSSNDNSMFISANSDIGGSGITANTSVISPSFSTVGFTSAELKFYQYYKVLSVPTGYVKISTNGNTWTTIYTVPAQNVGTASNFAMQTISLNAYLNQPNLYIKFDYISGWDYYWNIDNVSVIGTAIGSPSWLPLTGLYTNAAATIPYTGGALDTIYAKPTATTVYIASLETPGGCTSFNTITITDTCSAVPVTYTSFTGKKEGSINLLSWQTATEINNTGFELQRSADNKNFSKLDFIASKANNGNSNAMLSYNYTDAKPLASSNYYRLKQIDRDGKANYSNTILLKGDNVKQVSIVGAYPNPARNILNVQIVAPAQERVSLVVTDITGKILQQETMVLNTGDNTKQIDVSRLTQGTYIIKTICSNGCESAVFKFTKN